MRDKKIIGMFGGKFLPLHEGHEYVISRAFDECDIVYLCLFINGPEERRMKDAWYTNPDFRYYQLKKAAESRRRLQYKFYGRDVGYYILIIDCQLFSKDGAEDWSAEANYITRIAGHIDRVYSSEPGYDRFFRSAYKGAEHIIVDPKRETVPISSTKIRDMSDLDEQIRWMS